MRNKLDTSSLPHATPLPYDGDELLDWDAYMPNPPPRPSFVVFAKLIFSPRTPPVPIDFEEFADVDEL
jgi:hypothetical protein